MESNWAYRILKAMKQHLIMVILIILICSIGLYKYSATKVVPTYNTTATLAVTSADGYENSTVDDIEKNKNLVALYVKLGTSTEVFNMVKEKLEMNDNEGNSLSNKISISGDSEAQYIDISVTDADKNEAFEIANAEVESLISAGIDLRGENQLKILSSPKEPVLSSGGANGKSYFITGGIVGCLLGAVLSVFMERKNKEK